MKKFIAGLGIALLASGTLLGDIEAVRKKFTEPSDEAKLQVWFHWVGGYVTKKGITADLEAMKRAGVGAAHIFYPDMARMPQGPVPYSDEWFEIFRHTAEEAARCGIKLGIHNCGGWSSSGGPWIKPENSMKVITSSEILVDSDKPVKLAMPPHTHNFYRDVAVVAFPVEPEDKPSKVTSSPALEGVEKIFESGNADAVSLFKSVDENPSITIEYPREIKAPATLRMRFAHNNIHVKGTIEASADGKKYVKAGSFNIITWGNSLPGIQSETLSQLPAGARFFRITFKYNWGRKLLPQKLLSMEITSRNIVEKLSSKTGETTGFAYIAPFDRKGKNRPGIRPEDVIDLTGKLSADGTLNWKRPDKRQYIVLRIGYSSTGQKNHPALPEATGLECDKLSRRGLDAHWPNTMGKFIALAKPYGSLKYGIIDSYEVGGQNWTEGFEEDFARRRGYDFKKFYPALAGYAVEDSVKTAQFLFDWSQTVSDLFAENYYGYFRELCNKNGLLCIIEPYNGPYDGFQIGKCADIPTAEFWIRINSNQRLPPLVRSLGNVFGRRVVAAEAFTTWPADGRWQVTPAQFKEYGENGWIQGINQLVLHSYVHQPFVNVKPGASLGDHGTQFNRNSTWWDDATIWTDYVRRGQSLLQAGKPIRDLVIFPGDGTPNNTAPSLKLFDSDWTYDYCNADALQNHLKFKDGKLTASDFASYQALILTNATPYLTVKSLKTIKKLLEQGAKISGTRPVGTPCYTDDPVEYETLVKELWDSGKIKKFWSVMDAVEYLKLTPFFTADRRGLKSLPRMIDGCTVIFVRNTLDQNYSGNIRVKCVSADPEIWDPSNGKMEKVPVFEIQNNTTVMPLELAPHGSCFLVFDPAAKARPGEPRVIRGTDEQSKKDKHVFKLVKAMYRQSRDPIGSGKDVSKYVSEFFDRGENFVAGHKALKFPDPYPKATPLMRGTPARAMDLEYTVDGRPVKKTALENELVFLSGTVPSSPVKLTRENGRVTAEFVSPGEVDVVVSGRPEPLKLKCEKLPEELNLDQDWQLRFVKGKGAPAGVFKFPRLMSWSEHENKDIAYFSGSAEYTREFSPLPGTVGKNFRNILDLGEVRDIVHVELNGKDLGFLWRKPFSIDVTGVLKDGKNTLKLTVTNTWPNRMIGDERNNIKVAKTGYFPNWVLEDKPDSGNGRYTWSNFRGWKAQENLLPAGLLGPVRLLTREIIEIK